METSPPSSRRRSATTVLVLNEIPEGYVERRLDYLHPLLRMKAEAMQLALERLHRDGHIRRHEIFETWRSPARQRVLFEEAKGRSRVNAYRSAHQYGLAFDVVRCPRPRGWTWDTTPEEWRTIGLAARELGIVQPFPGWDPYHLEAPEWATLRVRILELMEQQGAQPSGTISGPLS